MVRKWLRLGAMALTVAAIAAIGIWAYIVGNVEQPRYVSVTLDGAIEVRDYPALIVAEVTTRGDRKAAVNAGFRPLAAYIFAKERSGDTVAMTAPVTQARTGAAADNTWRVRFIMPSKYTLETLPKPAGATVSLQTLPATKRAAIRFSGVATDDVVAAKESELRAWLTARKLVALEPPHYAYYNDPFTPGPLRRNEVLLDLKVE
jgi:SOUL heme-binding protein